MRILRSSHWIHLAQSNKTSKVLLILFFQEKYACPARAWENEAHLRCMKNEAAYGYEAWLRHTKKVSVRFASCLRSKCIIRAQRVLHIGNADASLKNIRVVILTSKHKNQKRSPNGLRFWFFPLHGFAAHDPPRAKLGRATLRSKASKWAQRTTSFGSSPSTAKRTPSDSAFDFFSLWACCPFNTTKGCIKNK